MTAQPDPAQPDPATAASTAPPPGTYRIDPERSSVRADVKAMFGLATVHGSFRVRVGEIHVGEEPTASTVQAVIDAASFDSANTKRDRDVTSAALLDAATYPDISFASQQVRREGDGWVVTGGVTTHGATDVIEVNVDQVRFEAGVARFHASARLDRTRFGITKKKGMVGHGVELVIEAAAVRA